jgi:hypothetical protein
MARTRGQWKGGATKDPRRNTKAYRDAVAAVRLQVQLLGVPCYFHRRPGYEDCPGAIDLSLDYRAKWGFTTHHLDKLMDGQGDPTDVARMRPAHRACNSRDGLLAQNARRRNRSNVRHEHRPSARPADGFRAARIIVDEVHTFGLEELEELTEELPDCAQLMVTMVDTSAERDVTSRTWPQPTDTYTQ